MAMIKFISRYFWEREFRELFKRDVVIRQGIDLFILEYDERYDCYRMSIDYHEKRFFEVAYSYQRGMGTLDAVDIILAILLSGQNGLSA